VKLWHGLVAWVAASPLVGVFCGRLIRHEAGAEPMPPYPPARGVALPEVDGRFTPDNPPRRYYEVGDDALDRLDAMLAQTARNARIVEHGTPQGRLEAILSVVMCRPGKPCTTHTRAVLVSGACPGLCCDHCTSY